MYCGQQQTISGLRAVHCGRCIYIQLPTELCSTYFAVGIVNLLFYFFSAASTPTNLMAVQEGPTGIRFSWIPPTPLGDTTGYRIYYSGGSSGSVDVSGGSTDNHLLTGLQNGVSYTISIVGTSEHLPSDRVDYPSSIILSELLQHMSLYVPDM